MLFFTKKPAPAKNISAEFDIEAMDVVSVSRCEDGLTEIGYRLRDEALIQEWYVMTTDEQHQEFVDRLKLKLVARSN